MHFSEIDQMKTTKEVLMETTNIDRDLNGLPVQEKIQIRRPWNTKLIKYSNAMFAMRKMDFSWTIVVVFIAWTVIMNRVSALVIQTFSIIFHF